jgi:hypothetical protein
MVFQPFECSEDSDILAQLREISEYFLRSKKRMSYENSAAQGVGCESGVLVVPDCEPVVLSWDKPVRNDKNISFKCDGTIKIKQKGWYQLRFTALAEVNFTTKRCSSTPAVTIQYYLNGECITNKLGNPKTYLETISGGQKDQSENEHFCSTWNRLVYVAEGSRFNIGVNYCHAKGVVPSCDLPPVALNNNYSLNIDQVGDECNCDDQ